MKVPVTYALLGLPFHDVTAMEAENILRDCIRSRQRCFLSTPNLNFLVAAQSDSEFRRSVIESDLSVADGMPLIWLARMLGIPLPERVAGSSLFDRLRINTGEDPIRVFFFGGLPGVAELASKRINSESGGMVSVGFHYPGMGNIESMSSSDVIKRINDCGPDFVVVALGAKKGQAWIQRNRNQLTAPVLSHLGAVVNFVAGTVSRAPLWMQRSGLEWLWRIKEESQLRGRYLSDGIWLVRAMLAQVLPLLFLGMRPRTHQIATCEILGNGEIFSMCGSWRDSDLLKLRAVVEMYLQPSAHLLRKIDLSEVCEISPAIIARLFRLVTASALQARCIVPPARTSLAYRQLAIHSFFN